MIGTPSPAATGTLTPKRPKGFRAVEDKFTSTHKHSLTSATRARPWWSVSELSTSAHLQCGLAGSRQQQLRAS